jgi:hypothetical protein
MHDEVWHLACMTKRLFQRWLAVLGLVAMLSAVMAMPLTASYAFAMSGHSDASAQMAMSGTTGEMPCHKTGKSHPDCPQKFCPEMGNCLVKCFQPMPVPLAEAAFYRDAVVDRVAPKPALVTSGSLVPPLLRPPSA